MRNVEDNPPDKALTLSEWFGMKIWQIATIPPVHSSQLAGGLQESRKWRYSQSGINYLTEGPTREADRSRTPLRIGKGKDDPKGKGSGKKGKKRLRSSVLLKERMSSELGKDISQVQQLFQKHGVISLLRNL